MREPKRLVALCEGNDDRATFERLVAAKLLPAILDVVERAPEDGTGGWSMLAKETIAHVRVGKRVIAFRDLDEMTPAQCVGWMRGELKDKNIESVVHAQGAGWGVLLASTGPGDEDGVPVGIVSVGRPSNASDASISGIDRGAIDDYILSLATDREVYESISELDQVPYETTQEKLPTIVNLLRSNGLEIRSSKRLLHLWRGITNFRAAPATLAGRLVDAALALPDGETRLRNVFNPLIEHTTAAVAAMRADST